MKRCSALSKSGDHIFYQKDHGQLVIIAREIVTTKKLVHINCHLSDRIDRYDKMNKRYSAADATGSDKLLPNFSALSPILSPTPPHFR